MKYANTPAKLCGKKAPFQGWNYDVKIVCKQICDYCAPTTPSTTTSTTTTSDNRRKYRDSKIFETFYWVSFDYHSNKHRYFAYIFNLF